MLLQLWIDKTPMLNFKLARVKNIHLACNWNLSAILSVPSWDISPQSSHPAPCLAWPWGSTPRLSGAHLLPPTPWPGGQWLLHHWGTHTYRHTGTALTGEHIHTDIQVLHLLGNTTYRHTGIALIGEHIHTDIQVLHYWGTQTYRQTGIALIGNTYILVHMQVLYYWRTYMYRRVVENTILYYWGTNTYRQAGSESLGNTYTHADIYRHYIILPRTDQTNIVSAVYFCRLNIHTYSLCSPLTRYH